MRIRLGLIFLLGSLFFGNAFSETIDTLEIFAFRVQFKEEKPDNSLTTGTGLFDSSEPNKKYSLDPSGRRGSVAYWRKHFEFANAYFSAASGNKLALRWRIFPESGETAYNLDKHIIDYNRTAKRKDEKVAEFDEARSRDYMTFIFDAVQKIHASKESPFNISLPKNPRVKRAFMIIHAGASRLLDGGSLGTNGANTPGDFMDVYVNSNYWSYLPPDSLGLSEKDSIGGLPLKNASIDTLKEIMVVSETASQDGLNWGINGIFVNQIARALSLPDTYDVVRGISRLGYFDVMDFAGYSAGNGFFPVLPSAWHRAYMGWSSIQTITPKAGKKVTVDIASAGSGLGTEIVKVPLSSNEYLLIENRTRTLNENGDVEIVLGSDEDDSLSVSKVLAIDSLSQLFSDSICVKGKCSVNRKKASGVVLSTSSFDAGLPASGIVVWKVNEWYLRESLPFGATNFWGGDTLRDHQYGIGLVEADGILTVGKTFKNALGQEVFDYGSGADILPHLRVGEKKFDTVFSVRPLGYGNTATIQGGYTGISVKARIEKSARREKTANSFMGDSVINFSSPVVRVEIQFEDLSIPGGNFPKPIGLSILPRAALLVDYPSGSVFEGEKLLVFGSEEGSLQALTAFGENLTESDSSVWENENSLLEKREVPLYRIGKQNGKLLGLAASSSSIFSLHQKKLVQTTLSMSLDEIIAREETLPLSSPVKGPLVLDTLAWVLEIDSIVGVSFSDGKKLKKQTSLPLKKDFIPEDFSFCGNENNPNFAVVGQGAHFLHVSSAGVRHLKLPSSGKNFEPIKGQKFSVVCSDFNRDGNVEAFVLGSRGYAAFVSLGDSLFLLDTPRQFVRGTSQEGARFQETSSAAVADLNGDGYPNAIFLGDNKVYAIDSRGIPLPGFPVEISRGLPEEKFLSEPLLVDISGDSRPEILVPASSGLLYAYDFRGKLAQANFPLSAGTFEYGESSPMSIFVSETIDSLKGLELYAFHRSHLSAFRLPSAKVSSLNWALPANGNARLGFFDAELLNPPKETPDKTEISEFYIYPNPVKNGRAKSRFTLGAQAEWAEIEIYDITGVCVLRQKKKAPAKGNNQWDNLDLSTLGSDVYSVRLRVKFTNGKTKQKFYRIGVIR